MNIQERELWLELLGRPENYAFEHKLELVKRYELKEFDCEFYLQNNGPGTWQRVVVALPKNITEPCPAVAVPFYFPEAMLGFNPETGEILEKYAHIAMTADLARRGFVAATAESYHLTYCRSDKAEEGFNRWQEAADALLAQHPGWTGMGKLVADTMLLTDILEADPRVDASRIGIAGHSLGGKMAFYTGCLDTRLKAILASDFGFGWEQTNWHQPWYWGQKLLQLKARGIDHTSLLDSAAPKPFCLLAGQADDMSSFAMMQKAQGYATAAEETLKIIHHGTGHRPPEDVLIRGYEFLEKHLKG